VTADTFVHADGRRHKPVRKFRKIAEPNANLSSDDPAQVIGEEALAAKDVVTGDDVVITSEINDPWDIWGGVHAPVADLDVPIWVVPSNGGHKYALYIDHPVDADAWFDVLDAMAKAGIVEVGYAEVSRKRGYSAVRPPWVNKPHKSGVEAPEPSVDPWDLSKQLF
jgi:hypothetical protein